MTGHNQGYEMPPPNVFEQQMDDLRADMREMRGAITKIGDAISKLSVLEERNSSTNLAIEKTNQVLDRVVLRLDKMDEKINHIELEQAKREATINGVTKTMKVMWGAFGGGVIYLGAQAFKLFAPAAS